MRQLPLLSIFGILIFSCSVHVSFCTQHIHVPQEPSHTGVLDILQTAGLLRPLPWDRRLTLVTHWDYLETESRRFS